jgi:membrane-associated PAP2 superfamily phosphatase
VALEGAIHEIAVAFLLVALMGAGAYWALLEARYRLLEGSHVLVPQWWFDHLNSRPMATEAWFVLINAVGAALAGIPVRNWRSPCCEDS